MPIEMARMKKTMLAATGKNSEPSAPALDSGLASTTGYVQPMSGLRSRKRIAVAIGRASASGAATRIDAPSGRFAREGLSDRLPGNASTPN
jgi:hypothetical protein